VELAQKAVKAASELGARRQMALSYQALAEALCDLGQHQAARPWLRDALDLGRRTGDAQVLGFSYLSLGRLEFETHHPLEACAAWQEAELTFLAQGHRNGAAMAHAGLIKLQRERGQFPEKDWQRCLKAARESGNLSLERELQAQANVLRMMAAPSAATESREAFAQANKGFDGTFAQAATQATVPDTSKSAPPAAQQSPQLVVLTLGSLIVRGPLGELNERDWPTRKAAGVFALLCHGGRHGYSDQRLVTHFWPDSGEEQARSSLRSALHQIRSSLKKIIQLPESQGIQRSRKVGTVHLELPMRLDITEQSLLLKQGEDHYLRQDYPAALTLLNQAADLYRGDFLESFREEWTDAPRLGYRESALRVFHLLCLCNLALKQGQAAEQAARRGLKLDDLSEELHIGLMEAYLLQGLKGEALRHYRKTLQKFEDELSLYPHSFDSIFARLIL